MRVTRHQPAVVAYDPIVTRSAGWTVVQPASSINCVGQFGSFGKLKPSRICVVNKLSAISYQHVTFPRFHRHLSKWENAEIGGQHEHEDPTIVYGDF
jgi:hypothetical protein